MIPGLENARFLRYGQIHRNTYINAPTLLTETLQMKKYPTVLFAGQICGVEGYVESIATGLMAGIHAAALAAGADPVPPPRPTAFGSLVHYVTHADARNFQPANITFDLLPPLEHKVRDRQERHRQQCELALQQFDAWLEACVWGGHSCPPPLILAFEQTEQRISCPNQPQRPRTRVSAPHRPFVVNKIRLTLVYGYGGRYALPAYVRAASASKLYGPARSHRRCVAHALGRTSCARF